MDGSTPNFSLQRFLSYRFAIARFLYHFLCLVVFVGLMGGAAMAADVPSAPASWHEPGLSFSIADFDGDLKPDLANVQAGKSDLTRTDYWIQLQLSAAGRQTFQIVAPIGGLQIVARDVNGDHSLDLVLTTAWLRQPVAILLNDGHGTFSRVEPTAFPEAFRESKTGWLSTTEQAVDVVGVPPQSREDICSKTELFLHLRPHTRFIASSDSRFGVSPYLISPLGRAPPFEVSHS
jgi:hypothetical protein